mgnify:CR=1 FL=1
MLKKLFLLTVTIIAITLSALYLYVNDNVNQKIPIISPLLITIEKGTTVNSLSQELVEKKWLKSNFWLKLYVKFNPELASLKQGSFLIPPNITYVDLLTHIVTGDEHQFSITFIEGSTLKDWLVLLSSNQNLTHNLADLSINNLARKLGINRNNPEGLFFPDTYFFTVGTTTFDILLRAHKRLNQELQLLWDNRAANLPYQTPYQALIMASIIEKESAVQSEHAIISSVFVNRLNRKMRLQTDPTVIYGLGERYKGDIKRVHLREKTAYNTYRIDGLPPTPIAMPGKLALKAAMNPETTDYLYFVSNGFGQHVFSETLKEHNKAVAQYLLAIKNK